MEQWYAALTAYLKDHRDEIVGDLFSLVRIPSIAKQGADGLPFGKASDEALTAAAALYTLCRPAMGQCTVHSSRSCRYRSKVNSPRSSRRFSAR